MNERKCECCGHKFDEADDIGSNVCWDCREDTEIEMEIADENPADHF